MRAWIGIIWLVTVSIVGADVSPKGDHQRLKDCTPSVHSSLSDAIVLATDHLINSDTRDA
jgi:hypothetical protein